MVHACSTHIDENSIKIFALFSTQFAMSEDRFPKAWPTF